MHRPRQGMNFNGEGADGQVRPNGFVTRHYHGPASFGSAWTPVVGRSLGNFRFYEAGTANANGGRWGDYRGTVLDPNGCTFWDFGEYGGSGLWQTWVGTFSFSSCMLTQAETSRVMFRSS